MKNKKFLLFLLPLLFFIPKNTHALNISAIDFKYAGKDLNVAQFYTIGAGNNMVRVDGHLDNETDKAPYSTYVYINLNVCTDMNLFSINSPNGVDNMYVYQSGQSCQFNGSSYKGKVFNIYFRALSFITSNHTFSGSFYLNSSNEHSIELINYYANFGGFPMNNNQSYAKDLQELKDILQNSNSGLKDSIDKNTEENKKTNETLKDSNIDDSKNVANGFFSDFESSDFGLSDVITMPLTFIKGLASNQCNSLVLPLPFVNKDVELPCMTSVYSSYFPSFLSIYQTITTGLIAYWVCINIFRMVQNFKNPDNDEIEVMDL